MGTMKKLPTVEELRARLYSHPELKEATQRHTALMSEYAALDAKHADLAARCRAYHSADGTIEGKAKALIAGQYGEEIDIASLREQEAAARTQLEVIKHALQLLNQRIDYLIGEASVVLCRELAPLLQPSTERILKAAVELARANAEHLELVKQMQRAGINTAHMQLYTFDADGVGFLYEVQSPIRQYLRRVSFVSSLADDVLSEERTIPEQVHVIT